jgi:hypothetical protein
MYGLICEDDVDDDLQTFIIASKHATNFANLILLDLML